MSAHSHLRTGVQPQLFMPFATSQQDHSNLTAMQCVQSSIQNTLCNPISTLGWSAVSQVLIQRSRRNLTQGLGPRVPVASAAEARLLPRMESAWNTAECHRIPRADPIHLQQNLLSLCSAVAAQGAKVIRHFLLQTTGFLCVTWGDRNSP